MKFITKLIWNLLKYEFGRNKYITVSMMKPSYIRKMELLPITDLDLMKEEIDKFTSNITAYEEKIKENNENIRKLTQGIPSNRTQEMMNEITNNNENACFVILDRYYKKPDPLLLLGEDRLLYNLIVNSYPYCKLYNGYLHYSEDNYNYAKFDDIESIYKDKSKQKCDSDDDFVNSHPFGYEKYMPIIVRSNDDGYYGEFITTYDNNAPYTQMYNECPEIFVLSKVSYLAIYKIID